MEPQKPIWTKAHVNDGTISVENAVYDYIDYYAETGELYADPTALKDRFADLCAEQTGKKDADAILVYANDSSEMLTLSIENLWQRRFH